MRTSIDQRPRRRSVHSSGVKPFLGGGLDLHEVALRMGLRRLHHRSVPSLHRGLVDLDVTAFGLGDRRFRDGHLLAQRKRPLTSDSSFGKGRSILIHLLTGPTGRADVIASVGPKGDNYDCEHNRGIIRLTSDPCYDWPECLGVDMSALDGWRSTQTSTRRAVVTQ